MSLADPPPRSSRQLLLWERYVRTLEWSVAALLSTVVILTFANITKRYFGFGTFPWADESARRLLVWLTFIGGALAVARASHLRIDSILKGTTGRLGRALPIIVGVASVIFFLLLIVGGGSFALKSMDRVTPGMQISTAWTTASLPIGGMLFMFSYFGRLRFGAAAPIVVGGGSSDQTHNGSDQRSQRDT